MGHIGFMKLKSVPLKAHVSPETKDKFSALASARGMSTSHLLGIVIDAVLRRGAEDAPTPAPKTDLPTEQKSEALATRVAPAEWAKIADEIKKRKITASGFIRLLLRAHFTKGPAFDPMEVAALREANMSLSKVGRLLNQGIKHLATNPYADPSRALPEQTLTDLEREIRKTRKQIEELLAENLRSWGNHE